MKGELRIGVRVKHSIFGLTTYFKVTLCCHATRYQ